MIFERFLFWYSKVLLYSIKKNLWKIKMFLNISSFLPMKATKFKKKSKYLDEFHPNLKTPENANFKQSDIISDSPFIEWLNEIANFVYITPTPHEIVGSWRKGIFRDENERKEKKSKFCGEGQENKENMKKSTVKFKYCRGSFEFLGSVYL